MLTYLIFTPLVCAYLFCLGKALVVQFSAAELSDIALKWWAYSVGIFSVSIIIDQVLFNGVSSDPGPAIFVIVLACFSLTVETFILLMITLVISRVITWAKSLKKTK